MLHFIGLARAVFKTARYMLLPRCTEGETEAQGGAGQTNNGQSDVETETA